MAWGRIRDTDQDLVARRRRDRRDPDGPSHIQVVSANIARLCVGIAASSRDDGV